MKKIAFIGTHGIGKTTVTHHTVAELKRRGIHAEFLGEVVRNCPFPINEETSKESQMWILHSQIVKEIEMNGKCDWLVCDRSIFDTYVYYFNKFGRNRGIETFLRDYVKSYDLLVRIPINEDFLKEDGIRSVNPEFQREIEDKMLVLLKEMEVDFVDFESVDFVCGLIMGKGS